MTVKGDEIPEFVKGIRAAQRGEDCLKHAPKAWKRGFRAYRLQQKYRRKAQEREQFAMA
jgi:hypothetical protein